MLHSRQFFTDYPGSWCLVLKINCKYLGSTRKNFRKVPLTGHQNR
jgi:hypothetical protein